MGGSISILPQPIIITIIVKSLWRGLNSVVGIYLCCLQGLYQRVQHARLGVYRVYASGVFVSWLMVGYGIQVGTHSIEAMKIT